MRPLGRPARRSPMEPPAHLPEGVRAAIMEANARQRAGQRKPKPKKREPVVEPGQLMEDDDPETIEHCLVVAALEAAGLCYQHSPNGERRTREGGGRLRRMGAKAGFPDLVILTPAPATGRPTAIEMKRPDRAPTRPRRDPPWAYAHFEKSQQAWLARLAALGWAALVAYTAEEAIEQLRALGYDVAAPASGRNGARR